MPGLKICIHGRNNNNTIIEKEYPQFDEALFRIKSEGGALVSQDVRIVFEPSAVKPLFESIMWGRKYKIGDVEQAGILMGNYYRECTAHKEIIWADVVMTVSADPCLVHASFQAIDITTDAWRKMYEDAAGFRLDNLQIIGWYHTHLDQINTRFSGVDRTTQRKAFTYEYSFGVVFNPNQQKWSAFYGPESHECVGELVLDQELTARYGKQQITIRQINGDARLRQEGEIVCSNEEHRSSGEHSLQERNQKDGDEILSLGQLCNQFVKGVSQLIMKPCRHKESFGKQAGCVDPAGIEIRSPIQVNTIANCTFYSLSENNEFVKNPDGGYMLNPNDINNIIQHMQSNEVKRTNNNALWGNINRENSNIRILIAPSESEANARIILSNNIFDDNNNKIVAIGVRKSGKNNIKFAILVNENYIQCYDIKVIFLTGEI